MFGDTSSLLHRLGTYIERFRRVILHYFYLWLAIFGATTTLPLDPNEYRGWNFSGWLGHSLAQWILARMESGLLPRQETIIVVAPFDPLIVLTEIGAGVALLVVVVYGLFRLLRFAWPGLKLHERYWAKRLLVAAPFLLVMGCALGFFVLPWVYEWAYQLALYTGAAPTISLTEFVSTTLIFVLSVGASFEIPVLVGGLSSAGILKTDTMRSHWRGAVFGCLILAFLISPGIGGGWIEIPLWGLYCLLLYAGYRLAKRIEYSQFIRSGYPLMRRLEATRKRMEEEPDETPV